MVARNYLKTPGSSKFDTIGFIDLEASGLGSKSWPIEVGWSLPGAPATAMLICPHQDWPMDFWDPAAEKLHGVACKKLKSKGRPVNDVCAALNKALHDKTVYSDAPDWDGFWLYRLFTAAGVRQAFSLHDFGALVSGLYQGDVSALIRKASIKFPHRHRAHDDVLHMRAVFELASGVSRI